MAAPPDFIAGDTLTAQQMNQVGMWKIASGIVNSGSSFDLNWFSADYDSYKLVLTQIRTAAGLPGIQLRLVASGTPAITGYYYGVTQVDLALGTSSVFRGNNATLFETGAVQNGGAVSGMMTCEIHNPFTTQYTSINGQSVDSRLGGAYGGITFAGQLGNNTSYNTIRVLLASSTFTNCNYNLYGYRK
jgi:hypothetical protein